MHSTRHQRSVYWRNRQLRKMATGSGGDSLLVEREKCLCLVWEYFGFGTDDKGEATNTDKAVCTMCLVDCVLVLCRWGH